MFSELARWIINVRVSDGNHKDTLPSALPGVSDDDTTLDTAPSVMFHLVNAATWWCSY